MSIISGILSSNATNNATDTAASSQANATAEQQREFDSTQQNFAPYQAVGAAAAPRLQQFDASGGTGLTSDPLYQGQMQTATRQANQLAAANGQATGSGAQQTRLAQLGDQIYNNTYQAKYQQLTDALKVGQGAAGSISAAGTALGGQEQQGAVNTGNIAMEGANAQSALYGGMSSQAATLGSKLYSVGSANGWWGGSGGTGYSAGGADFSANAAGSGAVDNYGASIAE